MQLLSAVSSFAQSFLPELEDNSRNLRIAQDVSEVFDLYASRLGAKSDAEAELTNSQRALVRDITKSAEKVLTSLEHFQDGASTALDRAYANGEAIEKILDLLFNSLNEAFTAHHPNNGSSVSRPYLS